MSDDDYLSRWSRRKRDVAAEEAAPAPEAPVDEPEPQTEAEEAEILARLNLPVPESLQPGDDFSVFMAKGVPAFLRKRALRILWRSNPVLANLDGLNDYDDDFTSPELTQKVLATAYQVGRGFVSRTVELESAESGDVTGEAAASESADESEPVEEKQDSPELSTPRPETELSEQPVRPRRMRFET